MLSFVWNPNEILKFAVKYFSASIFCWKAHSRTLGYISGCTYRLCFVAVNHQNYFSFLISQLSKETSVPTENNKSETLSYVAKRILIGIINRLWCKVMEIIMRWRILIFIPVTHLVRLMWNLLLMKHWII